ncbi:MAG: 50S ribosomal protein L34e [Candidatus Micrarchaeota archaeon]
MPIPKDRATSMRKIFTRAPSGTHVHYRRKKVEGKPSCGACGSLLHGVSHARGLARSERKPSRAFGGNLCSECSRKVLKMRVLLKTNEMNIDDVPMMYRKFVK